MKWCVIIPTYNNAGSIVQVVEAVRHYTADIIVVNDGCTDNTASLLAPMEVTVVEGGRNRGKGYALKVGFRKARACGFDYALTIDADGQHFPDDIPAYIHV